MKKLFLLAAALFSMTTASFAQEQGDDNGFGLKLNVGLVSNDKFGVQTWDEDWSNGLVQYHKGDDVRSKIAQEFGKRKNTPMFGFGLDTRWYVANPGKFGIAVSALWADFSVSLSKLYGTVGNTEYLMLKGTTIKGDFLMPGIIGTYYLGDNMAADLYYNIGPSLAFQNFHFANDDLQDAVEKAAETFGYDIDDVDAELGIGHHLGAAFRYKVFQVGFEYNFAKLKPMDWFEEDEDNFFTSIGSHRRRNNARIFIGFKF